MQANIEDVAQLAGVSIATVSRTFKHPDVVAKKTRDKVLAAANELNFSISRSATVFQAGRTYRIALLLNDRFASWFNARIYEGLDAVFNPAGYDISVYPISTKEDRRTFFENLPIRRNADAVIIPSFDIDPDEASRCKARTYRLSASMHCRKAPLRCLFPSTMSRRCNSLRGTLLHWGIEISLSLD